MYYLPFPTLIVKRNYNWYSTVEVIFEKELVIDSFYIVLTLFLNIPKYLIPLLTLFLNIFSKYLLR